jgi:hypothetical protein
MACIGHSNLKENGRRPRSIRDFDGTCVAAELLTAVQADTGMFRQNSVDCQEIATNHQHPEHRATC